MIELYDALATSLGGRLPLDSTKYDREFSYDCLRQIQKFLYEHEGEMAILTKFEGKKILQPRLVQIYQVSPNKALLRYKCYSPDGEFRCYLTETVGCSSIFCRHVQLKVFGSI